VINAAGAGIDMRGPAVISNVFIYEVDNSNSGIRFRETGVPSVGTGGHYSSLTNFHIVGYSDSENATVGVSIPASYVSVSNGYIEGTLYGIEIGGPRNSVVGVTTNDTYSSGIILQEDAKNTVVSSNIIRDCSTYGLRVRSDQNSITGNIIQGCSNSGIYVESTSDKTVFVGNVVKSNGAGNIMNGTGISTSGNEGI
jgi:hypothetical protein